MIKKHNSLEIFEGHDGWTYRFHGDIFTYTQSGFGNSKAAFEAARKNDRVRLTTRLVRIVVTDEVAEQLGLDLANGIRSIIPDLDVVVIPIKE